MMWTWVNGGLLLAAIVIVAGSYLLVAAINGVLQAKADKDAQRMAERRRIFEAHGGAR